MRVINPLHSLPLLDISQLSDAQTALEVDHLSLYYGEKQALNDISLRIPQHQVTALIGPSSCGKSTLLRCFNRMNDLVENCRIEGDIRLRGVSVRDAQWDVSALRRRVGMVFQRPNPFPKSIYDNVAYGLRLQGIRDRRLLDKTVENALRAAAPGDCPCHCDRARSVTAG